MSHGGTLDATNALWLMLDIGRCMLALGLREVGALALRAAALSLGRLRRAKDRGTRLTDGEVVRVASHTGSSPMRRIDRGEALGYESRS